MKYLFLIIGFSLLAHAECETQKSELDSAQTLCNDAIAASAVATTGGAIAIPVFGGFIFGTGPAFIAQNQCRIRDEKQQNLADCEKDAHELQARLAAEAQRQTELEQEQAERNAIVQEANHAAEERLKQAISQAQSSIDAFIENLKKEGFDPNDPNVAKEIQQKKDDVEQAFDLERQNIEKERLYRTIGYYGYPIIP